MFNEQSLIGIHIAITGKLSQMPRSKAAQLIHHLGGAFQPCVTRSTNILVVGSVRDQRCTNKLCKAKALQNHGYSISIISQQEFYTMLADAISMADYQNAQKDLLGQIYFCQ